MQISWYVGVYLVNSRSLPTFCALNRKYLHVFLIYEMAPLHLVIGGASFLMLGASTSCNLPSHHFLLIFLCLILLFFFFFRFGSSRHLLVTSGLSWSALANCSFYRCRFFLMPDFQTSFCRCRFLLVPDLRVLFERVGWHVSFIRL